MLIRYGKNLKKEKLFNKFLKQPFAKHNLETLKLLNNLRSIKTKNKYCLICINHLNYGNLQKCLGERGVPPKKINKFFKNLEDAERYVFKIRTK